MLNLEQLWTPMTFRMVLDKRKPKKRRRKRSRKLEVKWAPPYKKMPRWRRRKLSLRKNSLKKRKMMDSNSPLSEEEPRQPVLLNRATNFQ